MSVGVAAEMSYQLSHAGLIAVRLLFVYCLVKKMNRKKSLRLVQPALEQQLKVLHISSLIKYEATSFFELPHASQRFLSTIFEIFLLEYVNIF